MPSAEKKSRTTQEGLPAETDHHLEIERKFLLTTLPENTDHFPVEQIRQGYLISGPGGSLRVRESVGINGETVYYQTIKKGKGLVRKEIEVILTREQFTVLWSQTNSQIEKHRYHIPLSDSSVASLDIYSGKLTGLSTVEVEFTNEVEAIDFVPPEWFGKEVTGDTRYSNSTLSESGLPIESLSASQYPEIVVSESLRQGVKKLLKLLDGEVARSEPAWLFVAGRTSAGKSSAVTDQVIKHYGRKNVLVVALDDYFGGNTHLERLRQTIPDINWDHPEYLNFPLIVEHLERLKNGEPITKPRFNFRTGEPDENAENISPLGKKVIVFEGIHALNPKLASFRGLRAFVDISLHGSIIRRLLRDVSRTNLDPATILGYYLRTVEPMYQRYIAPVKSSADIVLTNEYDPRCEAIRSQMVEQQLKFSANISVDRLQKVAEHVADVHQVDYYFIPREGVMDDEIVRLRVENGQYFLTYKGPRKQVESVIVRPKFEFVIDEATAKQLVENESYGPLLRCIGKERKIYFCRGFVISLDLVYSFTNSSFRDLGCFLEVRITGEFDEGAASRLEELKKLLGITSPAIQIPYALM